MASSWCNDKRDAPYLVLVTNTDVFLFPNQLTGLCCTNSTTVAVPHSCCVDLQLTGAQEQCGMGRFYKGNSQSSVWNRTSLRRTAKWKRGITVRQTRVSLIFQLLFMSRYPETPRLHEDFLNERRSLMHTHALLCTRSHTHSLPADLWEQPFQENLSLPYVVNALAAGQSSMQAACV